MMGVLKNWSYEKVEIMSNKKVWKRHVEWNVSY